MQMAEAATNDTSKVITIKTSSRWMARTNLFRAFVQRNLWLAPERFISSLHGPLQTSITLSCQKTWWSQSRSFQLSAPKSPCSFACSSRRSFTLFRLFSPLTVPVLDKYILIASVWGMMMVFAVFLRGYVSRAASYIAAPIILVPLLWNCCLLTPFHYPSDIPAIAFFLGCLVLWRAKKLTWYYVCFAIACFNRETILFAFPCVMALYWSYFETTRMDAAWNSSPCDIRNDSCHFIKNIQSFAPGIPVVNKLQTNLPLLTDLVMLRNGAVHYFFVLFGGMHLMALALLRWAPRELQRLTIITVFFWIGMFYAGILLESRIFGELIPIYTAVVISVVSRYWPSTLK